MVLGDSPWALTCSENLSEMDSMHADHGTLFSTSILSNILGNTGLD